MKTTKSTKCTDVGNAQMWECVESFVSNLVWSERSLVIICAGGAGWSKVSNNDRLIIKNRITKQLFTC